MPLRKTLLVGAIFVFLGAYIYFFEFQKNDKEKSQALLAFKPEEVASIGLSYSEREIQLKRDDLGKWRMTHPLQVPADESTVNGILLALSATEVKRTIEENGGSEELRNFGLDKPQVKVTIGLQSGGSLPPLLVGAKTPLGNSNYVKKETEPKVLLTNSLLSSSFEKTLYDFRDKRILEINEKELKKLTLRGTQGTFALTKKGEDWFVETAKSYRAEQAEVQRMLSTLQNMATREFIPSSRPDLKKYGLDRPRLQIAFDMGEKIGRREIFFGDKRQDKGDVYATLDSGGTVYTVPENVFKGLDKGATAFRDRQILSFAGDKVTRVHIDRGTGDSMVLMKDPKGEWTLETSKTAKMRPGAVADYLAALNALRASGFADDEPKDLKKYGLEPPAAKISLQDQDGKNLETLLVGRTPEGYYAKRGSSLAVYALDEAMYKQTDKGRNDFLTEKTETPSSDAPKK